MKKNQTSIHQIYSAIMHAMKIQMCAQNNSISITYPRKKFHSFPLNLCVKFYGRIVVVCQCVQHDFRICNACCVSTIDWCHLTRKMAFNFLPSNTHFHKKKNCCVVKMFPPFCHSSSISNIQPKKSKILLIVRFVFDHLSHILFIVS